MNIGYVDSVNWRFLMEYRSFINDVPVEEISEIEKKELLKRMIERMVYVAGFVFEDKKAKDKNDVRK